MFSRFNANRKNRGIDMKINLYDRVILKDGSYASIVEIFKEDKVFLADIDRNGDTDTDDIRIEDIERTISTR